MVVMQPSRLGRLGLCAPGPMGFSEAFRVKEDRTRGAHLGTMERIGDTGVALVGAGATERSSYESFGSSIRSFFT